MKTVRDWPVTSAGRTLSAEGKAKVLIMCEEHMGEFL